MSMPRRLNIAIVAATALTIITWSVPAGAAPEDSPPSAAVSQMEPEAAPQMAPAKKAVRRAAVRKRVAWAPRYYRRAVPVAYRIPAPYERIATHFPFLFLGIGY